MSLEKTYFISYFLILIEKKFKNFFTTFASFFENYVINYCESHDIIQKKEINQYDDKLKF